MFGKLFALCLLASRKKYAKQHRRRVGEQAGRGRILDAAPLAIGSGRTFCETQVSCEPKANDKSTPTLSPKLIRYSCVIAVTYREATLRRGAREVYARNGIPRQRTETHSRN